MTQTEATRYALAATTGIVHKTTDAVFTEHQTQVTKQCRRGTVRGYVVAPRELHPWERFCPKCFPEG